MMSVPFAGLEVCAQSLGTSNCVLVCQALSEQYLFVCLFVYFYSTNNEEGEVLQNVFHRFKNVEKYTFLLHLQVCVCASYGGSIYMLI